MNGISVYPLFCPQEEEEPDGTHHLRRQHLHIATKYCKYWQMVQSGKAKGENNEGK